MLGVQQAELEGLGEAVYREAGEDPAEPSSPVLLARTVLGRDGVQIVRPGTLRFSGANLTRTGTEWRIYVRRAEPAHMAFAVAHELAHFILQRSGYNEEDEEAAADYLGAALIAPRRAFSLALRDHGLDLPALARAFATTETLVALRYGESTSTPIALVRPGLVRVRSQPSFVWPDASTLVRWAKERPPPGLAKTRLRDDPRRTMLSGEGLDDVG